MMGQMMICSVIMDDSDEGCFYQQDFILEHYSEDGKAFEDEIADLMDLRQVMYTLHLIHNSQGFYFLIVIYAFSFTNHSSEICKLHRMDFFIFSLAHLDLIYRIQACRTPSRSEDGIDLLAKYFAHLPLLESRFFSPTRQTGIFFTWYFPPHCLKNPVSF